MSILKLNNGQHLYYKVCGSGAPLLLLAGLSCDHRHWDMVVPYLQQNYQLILLDNRGVGQSSCPLVPFSLTDLADDVIQLVDHLAISQVNLLGHSMGGAIAKICAHKYPQRINKLIISNSLIQPNEMIDRWGESLLTMKKRLPGSRYEQTLLSFLLVYSDHFLRTGPHPIF